MQYPEIAGPTIRFHGIFRFLAVEQQVMVTWISQEIAIMRALNHLFQLINPQYSPKNWQTAYFHKKIAQATKQLKPPHRLTDLRETL
ncbi:hypothetical protein C4E24_05820 [ANME-1 cluster archaeon AG-394-G21]|nr:hypothetical protein [ANME-1 cluster archaeon AG-394-G21]